jgi:hypothetical protein
MALKKRVGHYFIFKFILNIIYLPFIRNIFMIPIINTQKESCMLNLKKYVEGRPVRKFLGCEIPPETFEILDRYAKKHKVTKTIVIRALIDSLAEEKTSAKTRKLKAS